MPPKQHESLRHPPGHGAPDAAKMSPASVSQQTPASLQAKVRLTFSFLNQSKTWMSKAATVTGQSHYEYGPEGQVRAAGNGSIIAADLDLAVHAARDKVIQQQVWLETCTRHRRASPVCTQLRQIDSSTALSLVSGAGHLSHAQSGHRRLEACSATHPAC